MIRAYLTKGIALVLFPSIVLFARIGLDGLGGSDLALRFGVPVLFFAATALSVRNLFALRRRESDVMWGGLLCILTGFAVIGVALALMAM